MTKELANDLDPAVPQEEIDAAAKEIEQKEPEAKETEGKEAEEGAEEKGEEGAEPPPQKPPKGFVPTGAMKEERERRKALERHLAQSQAEHAQRTQLMEQRLYQIQQAAQAQQVPSWDENPLEYVRYGTEQAHAELAQLREYHRQQAENNNRQQQEAQWRSQLESAVSEDVREFVEETPDYLEAIADLRERRFRQYTALGNTPQSAAQLVARDEYQLAAAALQNGRSPAKAAYEIALASGYTKKAASKPEGATRMESLQKGVKAASSLGSGGTPTGKVTLEALADMNDEDFGAFMKSGGWQKLG